MKEPRFVLDYLRDILEAMDKAEEFTSGLDLPMFTRDDKSAFAVIRCLEIIGEAARKVPVNLRRRFADIPWQSLAGMRDKLIHGYAGSKFGSCLADSQGGYSGGAPNADYYFGKDASRRRLNRHYSGLIWAFQSSLQVGYKKYLFPHFLFLYLSPF